MLSCQQRLPSLDAGAWLQARGVRKLAVHAGRNRLQRSRTGSAHLSISTKNESTDGDCRNEEKAGKPDK